MNIEDSIKELKSEVNDGKECRYIDLVGDECVEFFQLIETLLTAYEKEKEKNESLIKERAIETIYVDRNFIRKDKIKPIQIIDLDGKIHNVYKIEEE